MNHANMEELHIVMNLERIHCQYDVFNYSMSVRDIAKEMMAGFWNKHSEIEERSQQKGLQDVFESYIHNIG